MQFKVLVLYDEVDYEASEAEKQAAAQDLEDDFLTREEVNYYLTLDDAP